MSAEVGRGGSSERNTKGNSKTTRRRMKRRGQGPRVEGPVGKETSQRKEAWREEEGAGTARRGG